MKAVQLAFNSLLPQDLRRPNHVLDAKSIGALLATVAEKYPERYAVMGQFDPKRPENKKLIHGWRNQPGMMGLRWALLQPIELALSDLMEVTVTQSDAARLARGQSVLMRGRDAPIQSGEAFAICKGTLIALCQMEKGELVPVRVFNYQGG